MERKTKTRFGISAVVYGMVNAVLFGAGLIIVLTFPPLRENLVMSIAVAVGASFALAVPIAWWIAPRLRRPTGKGSSA